MTTSRFDALNALGLIGERRGDEWSPVEQIADDLGESMSAIEALLHRCQREGLVERRGTDQDPAYRLTRSGEMLLAEGLQRR